MVMRLWLSATRHEFVRTLSPLVDLLRSSTSRRNCRRAVQLFDHLRRLVHRSSFEVLATLLFGLPMSNVIVVRSTARSRRVDPSMSLNRRVTVPVGRIAPQTGWVSNEALEY